MIYGCLVVPKQSANSEDQWVFFKKEITINIKFNQKSLK